jgi:hypothetical protein
MRSMQIEKEQQQQQQQQIQATPQTPYDDFSVITSPFTPQRSYSGTNYPSTQQYSPPSAPPMPTPQPYSVQTPPPALPVTPSPSIKGNSASNELDLNDPSTLEIYSRILLFKDDHMRDELAFSRTLSPKQRRIVHLVAQKLGVYHYSIGEGEERYAVVTRIDPEKVCSSIRCHWIGLTVCIDRDNRGTTTQVCNVCRPLISHRPLPRLVASHPLCA